MQQRMSVVLNSSSAFEDLLNSLIFTQGESKVEVKQAIADYLLRETRRDFAFAELQNEPLLMAIAADAISTETDVNIFSII